MENEKKFISAAALPENKNWDKLIKREGVLYTREGDVRSEFERDYTRILHCLAFRRLKHKTQVYMNVDDDHICTRMEHVMHVESVSHTLALRLGLNTELTKSISIGHDLGHAPFGHHGEIILNELSNKFLNEKFWHEKNGFHFVEDVELLEDDYKIKRNLNLTYAVRDGIISHCGEVDENGLRPREEIIDLKAFVNKGQYQSATWEGCIVKISDKIAYLGRDIEDAIRLGIISSKEIEILEEMAKTNDKDAINTTVIIHNMINNICQNSSPDSGICLSDIYFDKMNIIKKFNYDFIYENKRFDPYRKYTNLIIKEIFNVLLDTYRGEDTFICLNERKRIYNGELIGGFAKWLACYCLLENSYIDEEIIKYDNKKIYKNLETEDLYIRAILDYISGMTDAYAIKVFNGLLKY